MKICEFELNDEDAENGTFPVNGNEGMTRPLRLTFFSELIESPSPKPWLIKGVLSRDETSSWIAPPGKGKSALFADIAVHEAAGKDWRGYRVKHKTGVVYFALERAALTKRSLAQSRGRP